MGGVVVWSCNETRWETLCIALINHTVSLCVFVCEERKGGGPLDRKRGCNVAARRLDQSTSNSAAANLSNFSPSQWTRVFIPCTSEAQGDNTGAFSCGCAVTAAAPGRCHRRRQATDKQPALPGAGSHQPAAGNREGSASLEGELASWH